MASSDLPTQTTRLVSESPHRLEVRKLAHRRVRPWRVYYRDGKGRLVRTGNGWNNWACAMRHVHSWRRMGL